MLNVAYLLVALVTTPAGSIDAYIIDHDLTADDCAYALTQQGEGDPLVCVPDMGVDIVIPAKK